MQIHERFMKTPTTGVNILETLAGDREKESSIIRELVETYNKRIIDDGLDLKTLETFRTILCYEYQSLLNSPTRDAQLKCTECVHARFPSVCFLKYEHLTREVFSALYDIVILQLVLYHKQSIAKWFECFLGLQPLLSNRNHRELSMRVSECFADSCNLRTYVYKSMDCSAEVDGQANRILSIIKLWINQEDIEWKILASLLPKLAVTFDPRKIVFSLWNYVINSPNISTTGMEKALALCVMADVCFPLEKEKVRDFHYEQCVQQKFWLIVNQGLISKVYQQRKQSLYLLKRAVEFAEAHEEEIKLRLSPLENNAVPFVCAKSGAQESSLQEAKKHYFLILEVLEEKQKHLVLPALSHLPSLAKVHVDHKSCCDCFSAIWLGCVLRRIVQHNNDSIKIFGIQEILRSDQIFFDDEFMEFLVDALNNTFLYDYKLYNEEKPQIVKKLEECLLRWEQEKVTLINSFVRTLPSVSWGPVAIYWILEALQTVSNQCEIVTNVWGLRELRCVEDLIKKSLMTHNLQLRTYSQVLILRVLRAYVLRPVDASNLDCVFGILSSFPENNLLKPFTTEWLEITERMSQIIEPSDAQQYTIRKCDELKTTEQSLKSLSLTIVLLVNSGLILTAKHCPAGKALDKLLQNLVGADSRPYADQELILRIIEFSGHLINFCWTEIFKNTLNIKQLMTPYSNEILKIVSRSLESKTISEYEKYCLAFSALVKCNWLNVMKEIERFEDKCIHIIRNPRDFHRTQWSYAIKILKICREKSWIIRPELGKTYVPQLLRQREDAASQNESSTGKLASDCFEDIACLLHNHINRLPLATRKAKRPADVVGSCTADDRWLPNAHWFPELLALVETGNERVIDPVAATLLLLLKDNPSLALQDPECVHSIIRVSWRCAFQSKRTPVVFSALEKLTELIMSPYFLQLDGAKEYAIECVDQMMREGENVPSLKRILLFSMSFSELKDMMIPFRKVLMSCLLSGDVPRCDQRIERAAISHAQKLEKNEESILELNMDATVRAEAIVSLLEAIDHDSRKPALIRENILNDLLEILKQNKNKRYFDNSQLHRLKHRVMQTLLVMEPFFNQTETQHLYDTLCDLLIAESNQPSVRLMHEWLLVRLYSKDADMRESIWTLFETAAEKRPGSVVSLASVIFHVARSLSERTQTEYIAKAILQLLPNCMGQQFNVRLYSQAILVEIYRMLPEDSPEAKTYENIFKSVEESLRRGNLMKNSTRVLDDFYFKIFDANLHYNYETIYFHLPRLTNVSVDECILPNVFACMTPEETTLSIKETNTLRNAEPSAPLSRATGELAESAACSSIDEGLSDIQKKVIPWKTMVPFYDDLSEIEKAKLVRRKLQNEEAGIIVVASLIDRPPNLGGLARTCEIFGAKELVIGSLRYAEDREFQTLSVSAEKWITITEVKPHLLKNYLLEKQSEGWTLVGAEQTANSTNLLETEFPKKTILLLGNEKDGVPANLIPLMDTCVEIPQNGVVRSLNVHVTGAICIWQYAKQHVLT